MSANSTKAAPRSPCDRSPRRACLFQHRGAVVLTVQTSAGSPPNLSPRMDSRALPSRSAARSKLGSTSFAVRAQPCSNGYQQHDTVLGADRGRRIRDAGGLARRARRRPEVRVARRDRMTRDTLTAARTGEVVYSADDGASRATSRAKTPPRLQPTTATLRPEVLASSLTHSTEASSLPKTSPSLRPSVQPRASWPRERRKRRRGKSTWSVVPKPGNSTTARPSPRGACDNVFALSRSRGTSMAALSSPEDIGPFGGVAGPRTRRDILGSDRFST